MDKVEQLVRSLERALDGCTVQVSSGGDRPGSPTWIDVFHGEMAWVIEWRPRLGFGLSSVVEGEEPGFGMGADEVYSAAQVVVARVLHLFKTGGRTRLQLPEHALLRELRTQRRLSQADLAQQLGVTQANVSQMERRTDLNIQSLRALVEAMGGKLVITAQFGDEGVRLSQFDAESA